MFMKEILKENLEIGGVELPEKAGIVAFFGGGKMLMCGMTSNISDYLGVYFGTDIEDKNIGELLEECDRVGYMETRKVFEALMGYKALIQKFIPRYNKLIRYYDDYVYLGLNFLKVPFIKVEKTTIHDYFYVGPFRSRFFLHDIIDVSAHHFKTPSCPGSDYPCELLEAGKCKGYCIQGKENIIEDLSRFFLTPKIENIDKLTEERESLLNSFHFKEAEALQLDQKLLTKFYNRITFLMVTRQINVNYEYEGKQIEISNGLISRIDGRSFDISDREYQPNELYAVDKSELDERWIIYNEIMNRIPEKLKISYEITRKTLTSYLMRINNA